MTHLTNLQFSMYTDIALSSDEAEVVAHHIESCPTCRNRLAEFLEEKQLIESAFGIEEGIVVPNVITPKFGKPLGLREFAIANLVTGLTIWIVQFLWKTLFGELLVTAFSWITLIPVPDLFELLVSTARYFSQEGTNLIYTYIGIVIVSLIVTAIAWFAFSYRKTRGMLSLCFLVMLSGGLLVAPPVDALEFRRDDNMVTIDASETIDDTLIVAGETVVVDGTVKGDLVALGGRVVINGSVGGNLITFGEAITVHGRVGGFLMGAGSSIELVDAVVDGDLWTAADKVNINRESRIGRNATIAAELVTMAGEVERDLLAFGEKIELSGKVGEDFEVFAERVSLMGSASVGGNLRFRTDDENNLQRSSNSVVNGKVEFLTPESEFNRVNKYATVGFYVRQLLRLVSAFIAGFALLWLFPVLRDVTLDSGISGIKTAGIGLVGLVTLPVFMLLFAISVVGLPFTVVGFFTWLLAIYFAKIVLASVIGQMLLGSSEKNDSLPWTLLAGLVAILVVVNIPVLGGIFNFILTIVGIGLIVQVVLTYTSRLDSNRVGT